MFVFHFRFSHGHVIKQQNLLFLVTAFPFFRGCHSESPFSNLTYSIKQQIITEKENTIN